MENASSRNVFPNNGNQSALPNATAVLVLGIISIVGCFCYGIVGLICGIIAIVLSGKDLALYRSMPGQFTEGSYNNLKAGRVCAIIGTSLSSLYALIVILMLAIYGSLITNPIFWQHLQNR